MIPSPFTINFKNTTYLLTNDKLSSATNVNNPIFYCLYVDIKFKRKQPNK